jgi:hypothetical protein
MMRLQWHGWQVVEAWFSPAAAEEALARLRHWIDSTPHSGSPGADPDRASRALHAFVVRMSLSVPALMYCAGFAAFAYGRISAAVFSAREMIFS